mmetsp:Transcript_20797/g.84671  ORF Transcript_20797/g.84671 Transcript_20797/m.84671 type:complete len:146 (-) Transcript_20797:145-582(-)
MSPKSEYNDALQIRNLEHLRQLLRNLSPAHHGSVRVKHVNNLTKRAGAKVHFSDPGYIIPSRIGGSPQNPLAHKQNKQAKTIATSKSKMTSRRNGIAKRAHRKIHNTRQKAKTSPKRPRVPPTEAKEERPSGSDNLQTASGPATC